MINLTIIGDQHHDNTQLRRLTEPQQWLYLICFAHHRYQQFMDNLITSFMYHVRAILANGKTYADAAQTDYNAKLLLDFPKLADFLLWFPQQKNKSEVRAPELSTEAYKILPEEQFAPLSQLIAGHVFDKKGAKWEFYCKSSRSFALYLRPILTSVTFDFYIKDHFIMTLINLLKEHYSTGKSPSALKIPDNVKLKISKNMLKYLRENADDESIDPHRLEFFVYQKMFHHLNKGRLFCNESVSYADLDCDLIPDEMVDNIIEISEKFGFPKIPIYCDQHLDEMLIKLDAAWERTTKGIDSGSNTGIKLKTVEGIVDWTLLYDTSEKLENKPLSELSTIEITNLIKFIGDTIGIWDKFTHIKNLYIKRKNPGVVLLTACILAEAFGLSTEKMAEMSDLNANSLSSTREDFFNVAILCEVNDVVVDYIYALPIFKLWNLMGDLLLGDADGQKIPSTSQTIQSRYSKKFLGKGKGISIYTLLANFAAVNATNIGPNEYEGHSLYDMIYGNKTDVKIDMVTGDNHSLNKLNFVLLDSINVDYVPSIKNIRAAADELYSVKDIDNYKGILKPKGQINEKRIRTEKRGILRVLLSLVLQENSQTTIVRKLNSHARYARLRAGLLEYNKILKSTHVLNVIHDIQLRKALRTARNRTESYHTLQGLIRKVYHGIFKGKKVKDNRLSAHATRLVANCIIAYNSIILNVIYEKMRREGVSAKILEKFARISPIAWSHFVFTGRYNFMKSNGEIDIALFVAQLEKLWQEDLNSNTSNVAQ